MTLISSVHITADSVQLVEVIRVNSRRGEGTDANPVRNVTQFWSKAGDLLAEHDHLFDDPELAAHEVVRLRGELAKLRPIVRTVEFNDLLRDELCSFPADGASAPIELTDEEAAAIWADLQRDLKALDKLHVRRRQSLGAWIRLWRGIARRWLLAPRRLARRWSSRFPAGGSR